MLAIFIGAVMKRILLGIFIITVICGMQTGCAKQQESPPPEAEQAAAQVTPAPDIAATPTFAVPPAYPAPPASTPPPAPAPTAAAPAEYSGPYRSDKYPLVPKSRRKAGSSTYPEQSRLNEDANKFMAKVDLNNQVVKIFERSDTGEYNVLVREMICSTGAKGYETKPGVWKMKDDYKRFGRFVRYNCYGQYWSLIHDRIYFHSITYSKRDDRYLNREDFDMLGKPASHGCIRLMPDDAMWIYLYLPPGTTVEITDKIPRDEKLTQRLKPKEPPEPECYEFE